MRWTNSNGLVTTLQTRSAPSESTYSLLRLTHLSVLTYFVSKTSSQHQSQSTWNFIALLCFQRRSFIASGCSLCPACDHEFVAIFRSK